ncbi:hypothetical protein G7085_20860 [Tessaracoccus sp. HDW20]|uniref:hypothetical protein n=1 Tax=Tessaracoccus coleopterorum TaxID=2714950 RepID=UPI0018D37DDA|nr:hypothetical protein [Tessaracoccus coleopterorum]NHB86135.1 hypothetical protein [Tessaracoccus coleopterorum]
MAKTGGGSDRIRSARWLEARGSGGIEWLDSVDDFTARWDGARIVVLTAPALEDLPALPTRPRVFVLVGHDEAAAVIAEVDRHRIVVESILVLPQAAAWLREQLLV